MSRLSYNDKQFGPITYSKTDWKPFRIVLNSNGGEDDEDEKLKTSLTVWLFGWVFRIYLGQLIKPVKYKTKTNWDEKTIARLGRDWYYTSFNKEYGFSLSEGFLQVFYGLQNGDNLYTHVDDEGFVTFKTIDSDKKYTRIKNNSWSIFLPWTQCRLTEFRLLNDNCEIYREIKNNKGIRYNDIGDISLCPTVNFLLKDYDDTNVIAKTVIEETVYLKGEGKFKWWSWFTKPIKYRSLKIEFNKETGTDKGSWKGGTTGMSFDMKNYSNHQEAIKAFCEESHRGKNSSYKMQFIGLA